MEINIDEVEIGVRTDELLDLFQANFKTWPPFSITCSQSDYYNWKYLDNVNGRGYCTVALDGDKIVGCIHVVMARCKIGDHSFLSSYGSDAVVDKAYRRRGLYGRMSKFSIDLKEEKGIQFHYVSTHLREMTLSPYSRTRGSNELPFNATNLIRIQDVKLHAKYSDTSFIKRTGYSVMKLLKGKKRKQVDVSYDLVSNQEFDDPEFWMHIKGAYDFIIERDMDYLNWRYIDCPDKGYYVKQAVENGKLLGYSVCKINNVTGEYPAGTIVDLIALPRRSDVVDTLVGSAVDYFHDNGVNVITVSMVEDHDYKKILSGYGFVDSMHGNILSYLPYDPATKPELQRINDNNRILFHYGDTDFN